MFMEAHWKIESQMISEVSVERFERRVRTGIVPLAKPMQIAPHPATTPAAGVMATRPVIMP